MRKKTIWILVAGVTVLMFLNRERAKTSVVRSMKATFSKDMEEKHPWSHWVYTTIAGEE